MRAGELRRRIVASWSRSRNPGFEEDRTMSDQASTPEGYEREAGTESDVLDDARAAELMREVIRVQERHREGGIEPELDDVAGDHEADA
jgi:hypothetical protein